MDEKLEQLLLDAKLAGASSEELQSIIDEYNGGVDNGNSNLDIILGSDDVSSDVKQYLNENKSTINEDQMEFFSSAVLDDSTDLVYDETLGNLVRQKKTEPYDFSMLTKGLDNLLLDAKINGADKQELDLITERYKKTEADLEMASQQQYLETLDPEIAQAIDSFVFNREEKMENYFRENFDLNKYFGRSQSELDYVAQLDDNQKNELKNEIIDDIIATLGFGDEALEYLLQGTDEDLSKSIQHAAMSANSIATGELISDIGPVGMAVIGEEGRAKADSDIYDDLRGKYISEANARFQSAVMQQDSEEFLATLPEEKRNDPAYLQSIENRLNKEYDVILDLTGDGYSYKKEDRFHVLADTWDSLMKSFSETRTAIGTIARDALGYSEEDVAKYRKERGELVDERMKDIRTPLKTISEKFESGDILGGINDGVVMTGESAPMMAAALGVAAITRNARAVKATTKAFPKLVRRTTGFSKALAETKKKRELLVNINTLAVTSAYGSATTYNRVRDEEWYNKLSGWEQAGYIGVTGIAEGAPAAVGASLFNSMTAKTLKALASGEGIGSIAKGMLIRTGFAGSSEALTEGSTAAIQYTADIAAKRAAGFIDPKTDKLIEFNDEDFWRQTKDGAYAGLVMGAGLAGLGAGAGLSLKAVGLATASMPVLQSQMVIKQLRKDFDAEKSREGRATVGQKIIKAVKDASNIERDREAFYTQISEENQGDFDQLVGLQNSITKLAIEHTKSDSKRKTEIREEMGALLEKRSSIESKYDAAFEIDIKSERRRIFTAATKLDKRFGGYGEVFGDQDSVTVTEGNADEVLNNILESNISDADLEVKMGIGSVSSVEAVRDGLVNAVRVVKALSKMTDPKTGEKPKLVIHKTADSFIKGTDEAPSRGLWKGKGEIHLLAPAIKNNTAYHEAYHDFVLENLGVNKVGKLAAALAKGVKGDARARYANFLRGYVGDRDVNIDEKNLAKTIEQNPDLFGEEFLVEVLGDLSSENVSIEFKKGVIDSFMGFVAPALGKIGVNIDVDKINNRAKLQDVVNAIEKATGQLREGRAVEAVEDIDAAVEVTEENVDGVDNQEAITDDPISIDSKVFEDAPKKQQINVSDTYMANEKVVDITNLVRDFEKDNGRSPNVWIWMGDQLKRGEYFNPETGVKNSLLGGVGFSVAKDIATENAVWASGLSANTLSTKVEQADFIFIMAGSPNSGHNFSKGSINTLFAEIENGMKNNIGKEFGGVEITDGSLEEFIEITNELLKEEKKSKGEMVPVSNTKKWSTVLKGLNENGKDLANYPIRKSVVELMLHEGAGKKHGLEFHKFLHDDLKVPKKDVFNDLIRDEYLSKLDAKYGDIVSILKPTSVKENANDHDTYANTIIGEFVGIPSSIYNVADIVPNNVLQTLAKEGADIESLSKSARIKTAAGDVGGIYTDENLESIISEIKSVSEDPSSVRSVTKAQDSLISLVADFIEQGVADPSIQRDKRRKNPVVSIDKSGQDTLFPHLSRKNKKEIIQILIDNGLSKESAEITYKQAVLFKKGRVAGKKQIQKTVVNVLKKNLKLKTTEAKGLQKELNGIREKAKTVAEFREKARSIINERSKEFEVQFTAAQITKVFEIAMSANQVSAKRLAKEGDAVMDTFIERMSKIFDAQDKKQEMQDYIDSVAKAKQIMAKIKRKLKATKKGKALKAKTAYLLPATKLANVDANLISVENIGEFLKALDKTLETVENITVRKNKKTGEIEVTTKNRLTASQVQAFADTYSEIEAFGRDLKFTRAAERAVEKAAKQGVETTVEEEKAKLVKKYERGLLSASLKRIQDRIDEWNEANPDNERSIDNPVDLETTIDELSEEQSQLAEIKKETIIKDGLLPVIQKNLDRLLQDPDVRSILGISDIDSYDADALTKRMMGIDQRVLIQLEFKLDSMVLNGDAYGIEYVRVYFDALDARNKLAEFKDNNPKVKARKPTLLGFSDQLITNLENYTRQMFPQVNKKKLTEVRGGLMLDKLYNRFESAEQLVAEYDSLLVDEINAISEEEGNSVKTSFDQVLMTIFSMARQKPETKLEAQWYNDLKDALDNTIEYNEAQKRVFDKGTIEQMKEARDFLFSGTADLNELIDKVTSERESDIVRMVDFIASMHARNTASFEGYVNRFLGKELKHEDNYTHFDVRKQTGNAALDEVLDTRSLLMESLSNSSIDNMKKIAGASIERNPQAIGKGTVLGLDFYLANMGAIQENIILEKTASTVSAIVKTYNSDEFNSLIDDSETKSNFKAKISQLISKDRTNTIAALKPEFKAFGRSFPNPIMGLRAASDVLAFGGLINQTVVQSTVLLNVIGYSFNPGQAIAYQTKMYKNLWMRSLKRDKLYKKDYVVLSDAENALLQQSSVFRRDYQEGLLNAASGQMEYDKGKFRGAVDKMRDFSLRNLVKTDKLAAVAGFFTYYGDYLINEGVVDSYDKIDYNEQARLVKEGDKTALAALDYANTTVSATQGPSTGREQTEFFQKDDSLVQFLREIFVRYQRFAYNKKASMNAAGMKLRLGENASTKAEGAKEMVSIIAEAAVFHAAKLALLPTLYQMGYWLLFDDDEEAEDLKKKNSKAYDYGGRILRDAMPVPEIPVVSDAAIHSFNKYVLFPATTNLTEDFKVLESDTWDDAFKRWVESGRGIPEYSFSPSVDKSIGGFVLNNLGVYGQTILKTYEPISNLITFNADGYITSSSGKKYYVRPEDKDKMQMHLVYTGIQQLAAFGGIGVKEISSMTKKLDDQAKRRALKSDFELLGYERTLYFDLLKDQKDGLDLIEDYGIDMAPKVLLSKIQELDPNDPTAAAKAIRQIKAGGKVAGIESYLKKKYPDNYGKFIRDVKNISKADSKSVEVLRRNAIDDITSNDSDESAEIFESMLNDYLSFMSPGKYETSKFIEYLNPTEED